MSTRILSSSSFYEPIDIAQQRIVLIDDDHAFRILANFLLERIGAEVKLFGKGIEAIKHIQETLKESSATLPKVDAVIIDLLMPEFDGYAVAMRLRNLGYRGRIIAMTASADRESRQLSAYAGFDELIAKPLNREDLLQAIQGRGSINCQEIIE